MNENKYMGVGLMSGTSLDGIDLALVELTTNDALTPHWNFRFLKTQTFAYSAQWRKILSSAYYMTAEELMLLDVELGRLMAAHLVSFLDGVAEKPDLIASHGHTVFHQPEKGFSCQIGAAHEIAALTKITTVYDFRSLDLALGGQGAPLVPVGDRYLFGSYDYCLNLGGFSNISYEQNGERIAYDICPVNLVLNDLMNTHFQLPYDDQGKQGRCGSLHKPLFDKLEALPYYHQEAPKSLGREWVYRYFYPLLDQYKIPVSDLLHTIYAHIASRISAEIVAGKRVLVTGGGGHNDFLMSCIRNISSAQLVVPDRQVVDYKEALLFAFLGVLRLEGKPNALRSVTGASQDSSVGSVIQM